MFKKIGTILILSMLLLNFKSSANSQTIPEGLQVVRCTCYLPTGNKTADGTIPFEGICASNKEHLGQVAVVYNMDMQFIGYFECRDTGSHEGLVNGTRIDIYRETESGITEWQQTVGDHCIVQWVEGEG